MLPIESDIFIPKHYNEKLRRDTYKLDQSKLDPNECHLFFPVQATEEYLVVNALEHITFHPSHKEMNDKFNLKLVKCEDLDLWHCSFPLEFKDVCRRAGELFGMVMKEQSRLLMTKELAIEFPRQSNLLIFDAPRHKRTEKQIWDECEDLRLFGLFIDKQEID